MHIPTEFDSAKFLHIREKKPVLSSLARSRMLSEWRMRRILRHGRVISLLCVREHRERRTVYIARYRRSRERRICRFDAPLYPA